MDNVEGFPIRRIMEEGESETEDVVAREFPLTIMLNNQELATLLCSPANLKYLAIGFLFSEGLLKSKGEIKKIIVDDERGIVQVEAEEDKKVAGLGKPIIGSGGGKGRHRYHAADTVHTEIKSQTKVSPTQVSTLVREFVQRSKVFKITGGVHSAALCDAQGILVFSEDIGRHNAIDKVLGECLLEDIPTDDHIILTSGRVSSEILLKVAKGNIPLIISKSAPTDMGIRLADRLGVTLIGFARGKRMNVYTHGWRVVA